MNFITLMTDFGTRDGYTGVMKGVIYRIAPNAQIADLTHAISAQNIVEGTLVWSRSCEFFPAGTVHVGVVDPGVGTKRRPIAARLGDFFYVCPDNGLITLPLMQARQANAPVEIVHLNQPRYWLPQVSNVFHGRDIFSPVAAHLSIGVPLKELGTPIDDPVLLNLPRPQVTDSGWRGEVITVDHFGNLGTNIMGEQLDEQESLRVRISGREIQGISRTFGDHIPGDLVAVIDSDGNLAVAIVNSNAARELGVQVGEPVEVIKKPIRN